ncbi:MAG TPA: hypothetical protein VEY67_08525 [Candidatus Dormibacteraeota bacterium]|nr:hypothetical protein [Candidatus Dormibacteraeota bacterium]
MEKELGRPERSDPASRPILGQLRRRASALAGEGVALGWTTSERVADNVVRAVRFGRRFLGKRPGTRAQRLRRRNRYPLPNLWEVHPEARVAQARELGLRSVPLDEIVGTAVAGPAQRGGDFLPLPRFRSMNWRARWNRILGAVERLEMLPPVDLVKYDGRYWVTDGHNRVAAALYSGQVEIDAVVTALVPPGTSLDEPQATLAEMAADSMAVRVAGSGRWTSAASPGAVAETSAIIDRSASAAEAPARDAGPREAGDDDEHAEAGEPGGGAEPVGGAPADAHPPEDPPDRPATE